MSNNKKAWLDSIESNKVDKALLQELVDEHFQFCVSTNFVDIKMFQDDPEWADYLLNSNRLIIEPTQSLDQMTSKTFYWSSLKSTTKEHASYDETAELLGASKALKELASIFERYKIDKWLPGPAVAPSPIPYEIAERLGVRTHDTPRTEFRKACEDKERPALFASLSKTYSESIALQHRCKYLLWDGKLVDLLD